MCFTNISHDHFHPSPLQEYQARMLHCQPVWLAYYSAISSSYGTLLPFTITATRPLQLSMCVHDWLHSFSFMHYSSCLLLCFFILVLLLCISITTGVCVYLWCMDWLVYHFCFMIIKNVIVNPCVSTSFH